MIIRHKIPHGNGAYTIYTSPDFEYVDPTKHFAESFLAMNSSMIKDFIMLKPPPGVPPQYIERFANKRAMEEWLLKRQEIESTVIPQGLISLLIANSKKEQVKHLKNLAISSEQLISFIFKAWTDFGFSFSQYRGENYHNGLDRNLLPKLVEVKEDVVNRVGNTSLTDGQLRQAIEHRKVIVSKFLDKESSWHCFFLTYDSLKGKESWKGGQPHYHYISDKFGIPRASVVEQLKSNNYKLGNLPHIEIIDSENDDEE